MLRKLRPKTFNNHFRPLLAFCGWCILCSTIGTNVLGRTCGNRSSGRRGQSLCPALRVHSACIHSANAVHLKTIPIWNYNYFPRRTLVEVQNGWYTFSSNVFHFFWQTGSLFREDFETISVCFNLMAGELFRRLPGRPFISPMALAFLLERARLFSILGEFL